jgi:hypothetical protein
MATMDRLATTAMRTFYHVPELLKRAPFIVSPRIFRSSPAIRAHSGPSSLSRTQMTTRTLGIPVVTIGRGLRLASRASESRHRRLVPPCSQPVFLRCCLPPSGWHFLSSVGAPSIDSMRRNHTLATSMTSKLCVLGSVFTDV